MLCVEKHGFNVPLSQETLPFFYFVGTNNLEQVRDRDIWRQVMNENGFSPLKIFYQTLAERGAQQ